MVRKDVFSGFKKKRVLRFLYLVEGRGMRWERGSARPCTLFTPSSAAMELYNASSQGLVYRVSKQGRTSLDHPACKESSTGISEHGNF